VRQIRNRKFQNAFVFLCEPFSCALIFPARLHLVTRLFLASRTILLNDSADSLFLALLWEEASLSAQWDLPNGPAILHLRLPPLSHLFLERNMNGSSTSSMTITTPKAYAHTAIESVNYSLS
jgi:hypothetical protein